ncbi:MAG: glycosyltransferase [SAR324 cluster bacterium]|nr:glycosyltransferase [SAR324 cluster bacterium]
MNLAAAAPPPAPALMARGPGAGLTIDLFSNYVAGGWSPHDLEEGLGGSEEALVLWAAALAERGHRVRIYHNPPHPAASTAFRGAEFIPHDRFDPFARRDALVSWKTGHPWRVGAEAAVRIHWSSDVEPPWPERMAERLDAFVTLTPFHRQTMPWLDARKARLIPHGIDLEHLRSRKRDKVPGRAMFASSPDRGLETLLRDWPRLRENHPGLTLEVFYGWRNFSACHAGDPAASQFRANVERLLHQEGIAYRGAVPRDELARAYWEAEYWLLPLNRAESELFCLNAAKAMAGGATAVINRIGALQDTVNRWIDYRDFLRGETVLHTHPDAIPPRGWDEVVGTWWEPLLAGAR